MTNNFHNFFALWVPMGATLPVIDHFSFHMGHLCILGIYCAPGSEHGARGLAHSALIRSPSPTRPPLLFWRLVFSYIPSVHLPSQASLATSSAENIAQRAAGSLSLGGSLRERCGGHRVPDLLEFLGLQVLGKEVQLGLPSQTLLGSARLPLSRVCVLGQDRQPSHLCLLICEMGQQALL